MGWSLLTQCAIEGIIKLIYVVIVSEQQLSYLNRRKEGITMTDILFSEYEDGLKKSLEHLISEFAKLRTGRASAALFDGIRVDYYGTPTPLNQMASINIPDARLVVIQPWDHSQIPAIEKAIKSSDLGLNPIVDGKVIRIPIPSLTEERRKELVKLAKKLSEDAKVAMRAHRHKINDALKKLQKDGEISEDDLHRDLDKVQDMLDKYIKKVEEALANKEKEIMEI